MKERKYKVNDFYFENLDCEEKAYILGLLYSDGCIYKDIISFTQQEERKDLVYKFQKCLESDYKINTCLHGSKIRYSIYIRSKKIVSDLINLGCIPNKSLKLKFPSFICDDLMPHFIRGLFDGDGCIWSGKRKKMIVKKEGTMNETRERIVQNVKFTYTGNEDFVSKFQEYLIEKLGFSKTKLNFSKANNPNNTTNKNICTMEYSGRGNIKKLYDYMYKNATIFSDEKKAKFDLICALDEKSSSETELIAGNPLEP